MDCREDVHKARRPAIRCGVFVLAGRHPGQDDGEALQRSIDIVVAAEAGGFHSAWVAEHHFMSYGVCPSGITFAAHALGRTEAIEVGTAVSVLPNAHPVAVAEQTLLLDQLSGGRFRLGVGRGGPWVDLEVFGTGLDRYEHGFPESLDLLLRCLSDERVGAGPERTLPGDDVPSETRFAFREVPIVPGPFTQPRPPVIVACTSPPTIELAAERGLPMLLGMDLRDHEKAHMVAHYAKAAERSAPGRDRSINHVSAVVAHVADTDRQAQDELRRTLPGWLGPGLAGYLPVDDRRRRPRDPRDYSALLCDIHPVGSADTCVERLRTSAAVTGVDEVIMVVEGVGDHARTLENVSRLAGEVLPRL
jgi:alkanesulfonate monooxygenase SsuD/methylene tetrahydromethanopterin reductase-like flavin-dependent oxidoreductase (luciferase family)